MLLVELSSLLNRVSNNNAGECFVQNKLDLRDRAFDDQSTTRVLYQGTIQNPFACLDLGCPNNKKNLFRLLYL